MSMSEREKRELEDLLQAVCEESLDEAGQERLSVLLAGDEEAQRTYIELLDLHAALAWEFTGWGRATELEAADAWLNRAHTASTVPVTMPRNRGFLARLTGNRAGEYMRAVGRTIYRRIRSHRDCCNRLGGAHC